MFIDINQVSYFFEFYYFNLFKRKNDIEFNIIKQYIFFN